MTAGRAPPDKVRAITPDAIFRRESRISIACDTIFRRVGARPGLLESVIYSLSLYLTGGKSAVAATSCASSDLSSRCVKFPPGFVKRCQVLLSDVKEFLDANSCNFNGLRRRALINAPSRMFCAAGRLTPRANGASSDQGKG
jgi:hypothetical protein